MTRAEAENFVFVRKRKTLYLPDRNIRRKRQFKRQKKAVLETRGLKNFSGICKIIESEIDRKFVYNG